MFKTIILNWFGEDFLKRHSSIQKIVHYEKTENLRNFILRKLYEPCNTDLKSKILSFTHVHKRSF